MPTPLTSQRVPCALVLVLAAGSMLAACAGNPFAERDTDFARRLEPARTRAAGQLNLDQFRVPERPAESTAAELKRGADAARLRAMSTVDLSIDQVRASALERNLNLRVALVDPTIAAQDVAVERAKFDAVFTPFVNASVVRNGQSNDTSPSFSSTTVTGQAGAGVSIPLRTGGRVSVDFVNNLSDVDSDPGLFGNGSNYNSSLQFSVVQPLLRGAGRDVATASIKIAGYAAQITEARTKLRVISELAEADRAYWRLYAARGELTVRQKEYEVAQEQLARAERRVRAQSAAEIEVTRAQSGLASRLQAIIAAENAVLIQQRELKRLANMPGLDVDSPAAIVPKTDPLLVEYALDPARLTAFALAERMELLENELSLLADTVNIDLARNDLLPGLDLSAAVSTAGSGDRLGNNLVGFASGRYPAASVGLSGSIFLSNEAAEARLRRALLTRMQRLTTKDAREQTVRQDVLDAIDRTQAAWQTILAARQASILAGRTLQAEQRQFDVGARTSTDVLDAAARLADAQSQEVRAMSDYQIALVDLAVATGTVLGSAGVRFEPVDAGAFEPGRPPALPLPQQPPGGPGAP